MSVAVAAPVGMRTACLILKCKETHVAFGNRTGYLDAGASQHAPSLRPSVLSVCEATSGTTEDAYTRVP